LGGATLALVVAVVTLLTVLIGCAQHEGASTPKACRRNMREFVLFCDLAKDHCPTKKEAPGVSRSFALAGFLLAFRKCHPSAIARAADPPALRAPVSEALDVVSAGQSSRVWRASKRRRTNRGSRRTLHSNQSGCGRLRETVDKRKENKPRQIRGL
jgi:hypothetical protein